jgi:hypothetical protein
VSDKPTSPEEARAAFERAMSPDMSRPDPFFQNHNCWKCQHGKLPCVQPGRVCEYPHARND